MKKYIFLLTLILIVGILLIPIGAVAGAEEEPITEEEAITEEEETLEPSTWSEYFETELMPILTTFAVTFGGVATALLGLFFSLRKIINTIKNTITDLRNAKGDVDEEQRILKERRAELIALQKELKTLYAEIENSRAEIATQYSTIQGQQGKLIEMLKVGFGNNKDLVINGYAKQIAEIAGEMKNAD